MNTTDFQQILDTLAATNYGADLVGGKIHWTNTDGEVVAHAKIKALLSWAATNNSAMWAFGIGQFEDAGVPCIKPEGLKSDYIANINDEQAEELAAKAATEANAQFLYRAANGANGLYLAVFDFEEGSIELGPEDEARKRRSAIGYVVQMLGNIAEIMRRKKRVEEAKRLLQQLVDSLDQQIGHVTKNEEELSEQLQRLKKSINVWIEKLPGERKDVLAFIKQTMSKWNRLQ